MALAQNNPIPPLPLPAKGWVMSDDGKPQLYYDLSLAYDTDEGVMQLPVGGSKSSSSSSRCLLVDLYLPVTAITVTWTFGRMGIKPSAPSPAPVDPNWRLLHARTLPTPAQFMADEQGRTYFISGIYSYAAIEPIDVTKTPITMGNLPFDLNPAVENRYTPSDFTQVVLDPDRIVVDNKPVVNPKYGKPVVFP